MTLSELKVELKNRRQVLADLTADYRSLRAEIKQKEIKANIRQASITDEYFDNIEYSGELKALAKMLDGKLSMRRVQVLYLLTDGLNNKEIADIICVHEKTVKFHLSSIFKVLKVKSRLEAAVKATRMLATI